VPRYKKYNRSEYKNISGNSFVKTAFDKGNFGEFLTFTYLEELTTFKKLLTNVYIPKEDGTTTEIDLIMIDDTGIYVFESKNYSGWIFGDEKDKMWTQSLGNRQKYKFFNPIMQNKGHIKALCNVLPEIDKNLFRSYIVFSERCKLKKIGVSSPNIQIINRQALVHIIRKDIMRYDSVLTPRQIIETYNKLYKFALVDEQVKIKHIENVKALQK